MKYTILSSNERESWWIILIAPIVCFMIKKSYCFFFLFYFPLRCSVLKRFCKLFFLNSFRFISFEKLFSQLLAAYIYVVFDLFFYSNIHAPMIFFFAQTTCFQSWQIMDAKLEQVIGKKTELNFKFSLSLPLFMLSCYSRKRQCNID